MAVEGDEGVSAAPNPPTTPRGRLPVAGVDRNAPMSAPMMSAHTSQPMTVDRHSLSPRGGRNSALIVSSDDEKSPMIDHQASSPRSPRQSTRTAPKQPRSPKSPSGNDPITIFLRDSNSGEETYFSLRYRSTLRIVFTVFAERKGLSQENLKFSFNGQTLTGYETPYSLGLEDRARIDVLIGQRRI